MRGCRRLSFLLSVMAFILLGTERGKILASSSPEPSEAQNQPQDNYTPSEMARQIETRMKAYADPGPFPFPPISTTLRTTAPDLVEKVEAPYFSSLDYQYLSVRLLRFAKGFLNEGNLIKAKEYFEKATRYYKLARALWQGSYDVLDKAYDAAQWIVVYQASKTALGFAIPGALGEAAKGLGVAGSTIFDIGTLYTDYLLDKSIVSQQEARKRLIFNAIAFTLVKFTGIAEASGDVVKHGWGSSRAYPVLQKIIGTSEFKDAVLKEFMRLGGDVGDHVSQKVIEEVVEMLVSGAVGILTPTPTPRPISSPPPQPIASPPRDQKHEGVYYLELVHEHWKLLQEGRMGDLRSRIELAIKRIDVILQSETRRNVLGYATTAKENLERIYQTLIRENQIDEEAFKIPTAEEIADPDVISRNTEHPVYSCIAGPKGIALGDEPRRQCKAFVRYVLQSAGLSDVPLDSNVRSTWPLPWQSVAVKDAELLLKNAQRGDVFWIQIGSDSNPWGHWGFIWDNDGAQVTVFDANYEGYRNSIFGKLGKRAWDRSSGKLEQMYVYRQPRLKTPPITTEATFASGLIMDRSGSMGFRMAHEIITRIQAAKEAAKPFGDLLEQGDGVSIVSFSSDASVNLNFGAVPIPNDRSRFKASIDSLQAAGSTNIGSGIELMYGQLKDSGAGKKVALLLSDGAHNTGPPPDRVIAKYPELMDKKNWRIYTVGFGSGEEFNEEQLKKIAEMTGGEYQHIQSGSHLGSFYAQILERSKQNTLYQFFPDWIKPGESDQWQFLLDSLQGPAKVLTTWGGSDLGVEIVTPSGAIITPATAAQNPAIRFSRGSNYIFYEIQKPAVGTWAVKVTGLDVPPEGERYFLQISGASPVETNVEDTPPLYAPGEFVRIKVAVRSREQHSSGWVVTGGVRASISAQVMRPDTQTESLAFFDDGNHADGKAGDGVFGATYKNTAAEGDYKVKFAIGGPLTRTITWGFSVDKRIAVPPVAGLGNGAFEVPWQQAEISVLGVTQKIASAKAARSLSLIHKGSGFSRTLSGEFLVVRFALTNNSDEPVRLIRRVRTVGLAGRQDATVEIAFKDDKIQFHHYCSDATGKMYQPEDLAGYSIAGEVVDNAPIETGRTVYYSLVYRMPLGVLQGIKYMMETHYQEEIAGRVRTTIPWSDVQDASP